MRVWILQAEAGSFLWIGDTGRYVPCERIGNVIRSSEGGYFFLQDLDLKLKFWDCVEHRGPLLS